MTYRFTILIEVPHQLESILFEERKADHDAVLRAYFRTFEKRAFDEKTNRRTELFLTSFFECILIKPSRDCPCRQLLVWDLLQPHGNEVIDLYATSLSQYEYERSTKIKYLGELRRLFDFVMKRPYIAGRSPISIAEKYGAPCQPVTRYDYPLHVVNDPNVDPALIGEKLTQVLDFVRVDYVRGHRKQRIAERNYAVMVLAVTSGMRADELTRLDLGDLEWDDKRVWIRFGKGYRGSGKRRRLTVFTTFAQETIRVYLTKTRPLFVSSTSCESALFLTEQGKRITYGAMKNALKKIRHQVRAAGLDIPRPFGWHDHRRSFATGNLHDSPQDVLRVAEFMGHSTLGTLHRYVRPRKQALRRAMNAVVDRVSP